MTGVRRYTLSHTAEGATPRLHGVENCLFSLLTKLNPSCRTTAERLRPSKPSGFGQGCVYKQSSQTRGAERDDCSSLPHPLSFFSPPLSLSLARSVFFSISVAVSLTVPVGCTYHSLSVSLPRSPPLSVARYLSRFFQ